MSDAEKINRAVRALDSLILYLGQVDDVRGLQQAERIQADLRSGR